MHANILLRHYEKNTRDRIQKQWTCYVKHCEQLFWRDVANECEWQCPNIAGYILDYVEDEAVTGFTLRTVNGVMTIAVVGRDYGRRQESFADLELSGDELLKRREYSANAFNKREFKNNV